jgi:hypothetical protein
MQVSSRMEYDLTKKVYQLRNFCKRRDECALTWLITKLPYGNLTIAIWVVGYMKLGANFRNSLWSSIIVSTSRMISLYRRYASAAICSTELLLVSKTPVG